MYSVTAILSEMTTNSAVNRNLASVSLNVFMD